MINVSHSFSPLTVIQHGNRPNSVPPALVSLVPCRVLNLYDVKIRRGGMGLIRLLPGR